MNSRDGQVIPQQDAQAVHQNLIREYEKHIPQVKFKKDDKVQLCYFANEFSLLHVLNIVD
jgi:hypothetical protein